jgi:hypothetical protein
MPRVARSASAQFVILEGACRGYVAGHTPSTIADQLSVSRATVRARIEQFVEDGRGLDEFLDAFRPPDEIDHKLERRRVHARERQRAWQRRANGSAPPLTSVNRGGRPRQKTPDDVLDRAECMGEVGRESDCAHIAKIMRCSAASMTSGAHASWTTSAIISQWQPLDRRQQQIFENARLAMSDVVPTLLIEWGWAQDADGVWGMQDGANTKGRRGQ